MLSRSEIEDLIHAAHMGSINGNPKDALLKYALDLRFMQIHESDE